MTEFAVSRRQWIAGLAAGCAFVALERPAFAAKDNEAPFAFKFTGQTGQLLRAPAFAIPSYQITFFTAHQSTAVADVGVRSRLTATLVGVSDEKMRALTDAAHADLKAQFAAAGIFLLPSDQVTAAVVAGGSKLSPGNRDVKTIKGGITIGKSIRKAYVAYGAAEAPMIDGLHEATATGAGPNMSFVDFALRVECVQRTKRLAKRIPNAAPATKRSGYGMPTVHLLRRMETTSANAALMSCLHPRFVPFAAESAGNCLARELRKGSRDWGMRTLLGRHRAGPNGWGWTARA